MSLTTLDKGILFHLFFFILTGDDLSRLVLVRGNKGVVEGIEEGKESIQFFFWRSGQESLFVFNIFLSIFETIYSLKINIGKSSIIGLSLSYQIKLLGVFGWV